MNFNKVVRIGCGEAGDVFCKIKFEGGKLSIIGVEGPQRNGNCRGGCGQIDMHSWGIKPENYAEGWSPELEAQFRTVWGRWHLNDLQAGTPKQTAFLKDKPICDYSKRCEILKDAGLFEDEGHKYGHAWLTIEVPEEVLSFLKSLPDTDKTPAWV